jgi:hypothetical protein
MERLLSNKKIKQRKEKPLALLSSKSRFQTFADELTKEDRALLTHFDQNFHQAVSLINPEAKLLYDDYKNAILLLCEKQKLPLEEALKRLDTCDLGGFYARPPILWYPLDNAAKVYPLSMKHGQMAVFRLSAYLDEPIIPELLQIALDTTIKRFPFFATTIKAGFFWHYIDSTKRRFNAEPESDLPCKPMNVSISGAQSFRVLYYQNRISVEFFHILTDGSGGLTFLKTLLAQYMKLQGIEVPSAMGVLNINDAPTTEEAENGFLKAEPSKKTSGFISKTALQMSGKLSSVKPVQILHFVMDAEKAKNVAKSKDATVTTFMLALIFLACKYATDDIKGRLQIQVPVNMRKHYPSTTMRNFSMYCTIKLPIEIVNSLDDILPEIKKQLTEGSSKENMNEMLNSTIKMVNSFRFIPLFIKKPAAKVIYGVLGDAVLTTTLSNLGLVELPEGLNEHVTNMDFVLGTGITNRASCSMITVHNNLNLSITKLTADPSFENKISDLLKQFDIPFKVQGSPLYGN